MVFAGPSLSPDLKEKNQNITFRDPVLQGDIAHESDYAKENIFVIVDGYYKSVPSIWHKEILYANNKGKIVIGCSSLGAIRAAEMDSYGMIGKGKIYQWYKENVITRDPDVAVAHGTKEDNYKAYTIPIVNIKASLEFSKDDIDQRDIEEALNLSREIFFEHRTMPSLLNKIRSSNLQGKKAIINILQNHYIDQKKIDCAETIMWLSGKPELKWYAQEPVQHTIYWNSLLVNDTYKAPKESGLDLTKQAALTFQLCNQPKEFLDMRNRARLIDYSTWIAQIHGIKCNKDDTEKAKKEICRTAGIEQDDMERELKKRGVTLEDFHDYVESIVLYRKIKALNEAGNTFTSQNSTHYRMMMLSTGWSTIDKGLTKMNNTIKEEMYDMHKDNEDSYLEILSQETLSALGEECGKNYLEKHPKNIQQIAGIPHEYIMLFAKKYKFYEEVIVNSLRKIFTI